MTNSLPKVWLIRKNGKKVKAHIWLGNDTACRMASTGGLNPLRFELRAGRGGHEICQMCGIAQSKKDAPNDRAA